MVLRGKMQTKARTGTAVDFHKSRAIHRASTLKVKVRTSMTLLNFLFLKV